MKHLPYLSLAAVYLGLAAPAFGDDTVRTVKPNITLADKVACSSTSPLELERKSLTCFEDLPRMIQKYDGFQSDSGKTPGEKDGKLSPLEYAKGLVSYFLRNDGTPQNESDQFPPALGAYLVGEIIKTEFIPADVNGDCYLSSADDLYPVGNPDGMITREDLTQFQATSAHPNVRCNNYEQPQVKPKEKE